MSEPVTRGEAPRPHARDRSALAARIALAVLIPLGTLAGVVATSVLALVLVAPRAFTSGLEPHPESAALGRLVAPEVAEPATTALLWILAAATAVLSVAVARGSRRVWLAYLPWAIAGGALTTYALVANWQLAREAGLLAFGVGGAWSAVVALAIRAVVHPAPRAAVPTPDVR